MEVTNCRSCGRLFNVLSNETICPNCQKKLDDKFKEVKEFLDENPNASVEKVSRETHTSTKQIRKWIREERLILSDGVLDGITCDRCGKGNSKIVSIAGSLVSGIGTIGVSLVVGIYLLFDFKSSIPSK